MLTVYKAPNDWISMNITEKEWEDIKPYLEERKFGTHWYQGIMMKTNNESWSVSETVITMPCHGIITDSNSVQTARILI